MYIDRGIPAPSSYYWPTPEQVERYAQERKSTKMKAVMSPEDLAGFEKLVAGPLSDSNKKYLLNILARYRAVMEHRKRHNIKEDEDESQSGRPTYIAFFTELETRFKREEEEEKRIKQEEESVGSNKKKRCREETKEEKDKRSAKMKKIRGAYAFMPSRLLMFGMFKPKTGKKDKKKRDYNLRHEGIGGGVG